MYSLGTLALLRTACSQALGQALQMAEILSRNILCPKLLNFFFSDLISSLFFNIRTEAWKLVSAGVDRRRDQVVAQ